jgi:cobalt-zinc-cadmium efflux system outer membrane protein
MHSILRDAVRLSVLAMMPALASAQSVDASAASASSRAPLGADISKAVSAQVLERAAYVRAVLNANPSIEAARASWRAALARVRQAGTFDDPMIDISVAPLSIGSSRARFGYEVGISQQLPWFGKRALEREVLSTEAAASASDLETTRRELAMAALLLYDQYYVALRSLEINAEHVELMQSLQAAANAQLEAGRGSAQDSLQAEAELTHLEHAAVVLATDRDVVIAQMNELLHRDPTAPLAPPVAELALRASLDLRDERTLQQEAVSRRAEITSARLHARAEAVRGDAAERAYYPNLTVSSSYSSMWDMPQHRWMVGVGVNVPLPTERRAGALDESRAARAQYESEVARMSDVAKTQVYVAIRKLQESEHLLGLFHDRLLPVAREQVEAARAGFIASKTQFTAVVDAERNLRNMELDHKLAQAECDRRHAELERALGRIPGLDLEGAKR